MPRAIFLISLLLLSCSAQNPAPLSQAAPASTPATAAKTVTSNAALSATEFAQLVERISEPNGYFDTDNLISNESSYLHVMGKLRKLNLSGGAYIGVGPDPLIDFLKE